MFYEDFSCILGFLLIIYGDLEKRKIDMYDVKKIFLL